MPTSDEFQALIDSCDLEWTTIESVRGCKFTGKGDYAANSVFFPAGGICLYDGADLGNEGYYWTNTPAIDSKDAAYSLNLKPKNEGLDATGYRGYAHSVRAVLAK